MKIIAKFAGKNGSLEYENGKYYSLTLRMEKEKVWITRKEEWGGSCEYASFIKFLEKWTDINTQYD